MPLSETQLVRTTEVTCTAHGDKGLGLWKYSDSRPWKAWKLTSQCCSPVAQRGIRDLISGFWWHMVSWYDATQHITVGLHRCQPQFMSTQFTDLHLFCHLSVYNTLRRLKYVSISIHANTSEWLSMEEENASHFHLKEILPFNPNKKWT